MQLRDSYALVARLEDEDSEWQERVHALKRLGMLEPATLAQFAVAVVARLEDTHWEVRKAAFQLSTLLELEPATLAQHAHTIVAMLENSDWTVRLCALETLGELEPATLAQHALAVVARLEDSDGKVRQMACHTLTMLPRYVRHATRGVDSTFEELRSRLLGRIAWYRCRIRLRVRSLSLYWYALPYRPSGPGHARDLEAWNHMIEE